MAYLKDRTSRLSEPPAGSRGRAPGQGSGAPEAENFEAFAHLKKAQKFAVSMPRPSRLAVSKQTQPSPIGAH